MSLQMLPSRSNWQTRLWIRSQELREQPDLVGDGGGHTHRVAGSPWKACLSTLIIRSLQLSSKFVHPRRLAFQSKAAFVAFSTANPPPAIRNDGRIPLERRGSRTMSTKCTILLSRCPHWHVAGKALRSVSGKSESFAAWMIEPQRHRGKAGEGVHVAFATDDILEATLPRTAPDRPPSGSHPLVDALRASSRTLLGFMLISIRLLRVLICKKGRTFERVGPQKRLQPSKQLFIPSRRVEASFELPAINPQWPRCSQRGRKTAMIEPQPLALPHWTRKGPSS